MTLKIMLKKLLITCSLFLLGPMAVAQSYPDKPIRLIIPYAVGGANDLVGRILATELQNELGQPVIVENKGGAGGVIGIGSTIKEAPDGYTLAIGETGSIAISPVLTDPPAYDSVEALIPVAAVIDIPLVIAVNSQTGITNLKELKEYTEQQPAFFGSAGAGTVQHLAMELLKREMGLDIEHVPYRGGAPAMIDLASGQIPVMPVSAATAATQSKTGTIKIISALSPTRVDAYPDIPTANEQGYPGVQVLVWQGVFAPAGTPSEIVDILDGALRKILSRPDVKQRIEALNVNVLDMDRAAFTQRVKDDAQLWKQIVEANGLINQ